MSRTVSRHQVRWTKVVIVLTVLVSAIGFEARRHDAERMRAVVTTIGDLDRGITHNVASLSEAVTLLRKGETR